MTASDDATPPGMRDGRRINPELIQARRSFRIEGYSTLADVGMDGDYVTPLQISSCSSTGPVLLAHHWSSPETA